MWIKRVYPDKGSIVDFHALYVLKNMNEPMRPYNQQLLTTYCDIHRFKLVNVFCRTRWFRTEYYATLVEMTHES